MDCTCLLADASTEKKATCKFQLYRPAQDARLLQIYMSTTQPPAGSVYYSNWLPIGKSPSTLFSVYTRLFGPTKADLTYPYYIPPPLLAWKGTYGPAQS